MSQLCDASECQSHQARWAVIVTLGRVVVEAETADADWFLLWGPQGLKREFWVETVAGELGISEITVKETWRNSATATLHSAVASGEVMGRVVSGLLNKQGHRGQMMRKMKANSLAALVRMAVRLDLPLTLCRYSSVRRAIPLSSEPSRRGAPSTAGLNGRLRAVAGG